MLVTNDLNFAFQASDRIGILHEGKIIESGTRNEIINSKSKITRQLMNLDF
jgi:ABC-type dipeptide/oligopeptide/nickel transport system ATPase component